MTANDGKTWKDRLRAAMPVFAVVLTYMLPVFWLWNKTGYPDGLGVHITAHGEAGVVESWWYSYLLIERHRPWDMIAFIYMWLGPIGALVWLVRTYSQDRANERDRATKEKGSPA